MSEEVVSEQEKIAFENSARQLSGELFKKYTGVGDLFRYSPDLSASEWHVVGINEIHDVIVSFPVGDKRETVVDLNVNLSPDSRSINLHILDVTTQELELQYKKHPDEQPRDIVANAIFAFRKEKLVGADEAMFWSAQSSDLGYKFSSGSLSDRERFSRMSALIEMMSKSLSGNQDKQVEYERERKKIVVRQ